VIDRQAQQLSRLIDDLLDVSRIAHVDIGMPKLNGYDARTRTAGARKRRGSIATWSSPWIPPPWNG
jgi:hypothetical protein